MGTSNNNDDIAGKEQLFLGSCRSTFFRVCIITRTLK